MNILDITFNPISLGFDKIRMSLFYTFYFSEYKILIPLVKDNDYSVTIITRNRVRNYPINENTIVTNRDFYIFMLKELKKDKEHMSDLIQKISTDYRKHLIEEVMRDLVLN